MSCVVVIIWNSFLLDLLFCYIVQCISESLLSNYVFFQYLMTYLKPMALEQVLSDRDSEDEVDDDVADLEDRRVRFEVLMISDS